MDVTTVRPPEADDRVLIDPSVRRGPRRALLATGAAASACAAALAAATAWGSAADPFLLADPGALTRWGLPAARAAYDVAAIATIGLLTVAVVLLPSAAGALGPDAARLVRLAGRWSVAWLVTALAGALLALSDAAGRPVLAVLAPDVLPLILDLPSTRAWLSSAWVVALLVVWVRWTRSIVGGWLLLLTAGAALLPTLLTAHAGHEPLGVASLVVHVGAAAVWLGGLAALALHLRSSIPLLVVVLPRYSRVAIGCFVLVALSGLVTASTLLETPQQLWTTAYGRLLVVKVLALVALGVLGHRHRRRTLAAVASGRPRGFLALAAVEVVLMAATVGLAVGLSRTEPPVPTGHALAPLELPTMPV